MGREKKEVYIVWRDNEEVAVCYNVEDVSRIMKEDGCVNTRRYSIDKINGGKSFTLGQMNGRDFLNGGVWQIPQYSDARFARVINERAALLMPVGLEVTLETEIPQAVTTI